VNASPDGIPLSYFTDRPFLPVPWKKIDALRDRLYKRGVFATACYDPLDRIAGLEFSPDTDLKSLVGLLRELMPGLPLDPLGFAAPQEKSVFVPPPRHRRPVPKAEAPV
jgi:hypothetical protein